MIHYSVLWHVYDQFRRAMGKSLDEAGNFERIFKRAGGRRNLYNILIFVSILSGSHLCSLFYCVPFLNYSNCILFMSYETFVCFGS